MTWNIDLQFKRSEDMMKIFKTTKKLFKIYKSSNKKIEKLTKIPYHKTKNVLNFEINYSKWDFKAQNVQKLKKSFKLLFYTSENAKNWGKMEKGLQKRRK